MLARCGETATLMHAEYIMRNAGLDEAQPGIKIAGRNINNLRYACCPRDSKPPWRL